MHKTSGFTLLEITVVIVVIALVISGLFVGRNMLSAAEMRTIMSEYDMYTKAVREFSDRYQSLPGDMNNAESNWGEDTTAGSCPNITNYTALRRETCDGDGDGTIGNWLNGAISNDYEWFRAWQHLANAGMIDARFTGVKASATAGTTSIGINVPRSKTERGAGWTLLYMATSNGATDTDFFFSGIANQPNVATHTLVFGGQRTNGFTDAAILTPNETKQIDDKMDDGMPYTGNLRVKKISGNNCASTGAAASTDTYRVSDTAQRCQAIFLLGL